MPRTIVADSRAVQAHYGALIKSGEKLTPSKRRKKRKEAESEAKRGTKLPTPVADETSKDEYVAKIAKYVPVEVIAIAFPAFAVWDPKGNWVWFFVGLGALANALFLFATALGLPDTTPRPRSYFYFLSAGAFVLWAIATIDIVQQAAGLTGDTADDRTAYILTATAFGLPLLDTVLSRLDLGISKA